MSEPRDVRSEAAPAASAEPPVKRRRKWLWFVAAVMVLLPMLVAAGPYIAARAPFRNWALSAALSELNGSVRSSGATFDWFQPVALYDFEIIDPDGATLLSVPAVQGDVPLWRMLFDRTNRGVFRIERPRVELVLREGGSNLRDVLAKLDKRQDDGGKKANRIAGGAALGVDLVSGTIVVRRQNSDKSWDAKNIQVSARLEAASAGEPRELVVEPGLILDHIAITPEVCEDFLKFLAPSLARVARAGGAFSLELDECRIPLDEPRKGNVTGQLTIHDLMAGPGPMAEKVAAMFHVPDANQLAREEVIRFQLKDERVYHEGFALEFGPMGIATQGSVSLADQSLDVKLAVRLPEFNTENKNAPLRAALSGQTLTLPIGGTLAHPQIDPNVVRKSGFNLLAGVLDSLANGRPLSSEALQEGLREGKLLGQSGTPLPRPDGANGAEAAPAQPSGPAFPFLEEVLRERAANRERRRAEAAAAPNVPEPNPFDRNLPGPNVIPPPPASAPPPRDRPLRRGARRLLDALQPPGEPPPAPSEAQGNQPTDT